MLACLYCGNRDGFYAIRIYRAECVQEVSYVRYANKGVLDTDENNEEYNDYRTLEVRNKTFLRQDNPVCRNCHQEGQTTDIPPEEWEVFRMPTLRDGRYFAERAFDDPKREMMKEIMKSDEDIKNNDAFRFTIDCVRRYAA